MGLLHSDIAPEWFRVSPVKLEIICKEVALEIFREWNSWYQLFSFVSMIQNICLYLQVENIFESLVIVLQFKGMKLILNSYFG